MEHLLHDVDPDSKVGFTIESSNCTIGKPVYIPIKLRADISAEDMLRKIENENSNIKTF